MLSIGSFEEAAMFTIVARVSIPGQQQVGFGLWGGFQATQPSESRTAVPGPFPKCRKRMVGAKRMISTTIFTMGKADEVDDTDVR